MKRLFLIAAVFAIGYPLTLDYIAHAAKPRKNTGRRIPPAIAKTTACSMAVVGVTGSVSGVNPPNLIVKVKWTCNGVGTVPCDAWVGVYVRDSEGSPATDLPSHFDIGLNCGQTGATSTVDVPLADVGPGDYTANIDVYRGTYGQWNGAAPGYATTIDFTVWTDIHQNVWAYGQKRD